MKTTDRPILIPVILIVLGCFLVWYCLDQRQTQLEMKRVQEAEIRRLESIQSNKDREAFHERQRRMFPLLYK